MNHRDAARPRSRLNAAPARGRATFLTFVGLVIAAGGGLGAVFVAQMTSTDWSTFTVSCWLAVLFVVLAELRPLVTPTRWDANGLSVSGAFLFALLLLSGPGMVCLLVAVTTVLSDVGSGRARWRTAFNVGQHELSWLAAYGVLILCGRDTALQHMTSIQGTDLPGIFAAAVTFVAVNNLLVDSAIAMHQHVTVWEVALRDPGYQLLSAFSLLGVAPVIVVVMGQSAWLMPLLLLPIAAIYVTVSLSQDRDRQSLHDALTGLPNRVLLYHRLEAECVGMSEQDTPGALLLLDLDRFKEVNDTLGHHVGDMLLVGIAQRLAAASRPEDTVARLGGDEFAILLPQVTDVDAAWVVAERVQASLRHPFVHRELRLDASASIGIAMFPLHAHDVETIIQRADVAMYQAKAGGGIAVYSAADDHHSQARLSLLGDLRQAVEAGALEVHFQPKADAATAVVTGVEALVRWTHPVRGVVPPDEFIAMAETDPVMRDLTYLVLQRTVSQLAAWRLAGLGLDAAVNISARDLSDPAFVGHVRTLLLEHALPGRFLLFEVTERVLATNDTSVIDALHELRDLGIRISLDDFGTGYSSLGRLHALPVTELKIDRSFVLPLGENADAPIVRSVVEMAHALGLNVVAEGVETEPMWRALTHYGCDMVQGYYLARPMDGPALTQWLAGYDRGAVRRAVSPVQSVADAV